MSSISLDNLKLTIFGRSHSPEIGMTLEGVPKGEKIDFEELRGFLKRRAPGQSVWSTPRKEADLPEFTSGVDGDTFSGAPVTAIIRNTDTRPGDYEKIKHIPRPGHADYTAFVKYFGKQDASGGGFFSGRLTAPLCIAGGICVQLLKKEGIEVFSRIASVGNVNDEGELLGATRGKSFPAVSDERGREMIELIEKVKADGDSVGGVVECRVTGIPAGLGGPIFDGLESRISSIVFGIPAVKGIEFGAGFTAAKMLGSENNDEFYLDNGTVKTKTNNCGGLLGGITDGMPLSLKVAFKPTPSIRKEQSSVDLEKKEEVKLTVPGRHDACIVPRAVPCVEAAVSIALYDALISRRSEIKNNGHQR